MGWLKLSGIAAVMTLQVAWYMVCYLRLGMFKRKSPFDDDGEE